MSQALGWVLHKNFLYHVVYYSAMKEKRLNRSFIDRNKSAPDSRDRSRRQAQNVVPLRLRVIKKSIKKEWLTTAGFEPTGFLYLSIRNPPSA